MVGFGQYKSTSAYEEGSDRFALQDLLTDINSLAAEL